MHNLGLDDSSTRQVELTQLREWLNPHSEQQNLVVVYGQPGVGKTWLAHRFAEQVRDDYASVHWLDAEDKDSFKESLLSLINIDPLDVSSLEIESDLIQQALKSLSGTQNISQLLILDNFDIFKADSEITEDEPDLRYLLMRKAKCSVLILSQVRPLDTRLTIELKPFIEISQSTSVLSEFCIQQSTPKWNWTAAIFGQNNTNPEFYVDSLAKKLGDLPLTLSIASAYLKKTGTRVADYLATYDKLFNKSMATHHKTLPVETIRLYTVLEITRREIEKRDQIAAVLLKFLGYFDSPSLQYERFKNRTEKGKQEHIPSWYTDLVRSRERFDRTVNLLVSFSLVDESLAKRTSHSLIQSWIVHCLNDQPDPVLYCLAEHCILCFSVSIEFITPLTRRRWLLRQFKYFWQGRVAKKWISVLKRDFQAVSSLIQLCDLAGRPADIAEILIEEYTLPEEGACQNYGAVLETIKKLAWRQRDLGRLDLAEKHLLMVLERHEQVNNTNGFDIGTVLSSLVEIYNIQGRDADADDLYVKWARIREHKLERTQKSTDEEK